MICCMYEMYLRLCCILIVLLMEFYIRKYYIYVCVCVYMYFIIRMISDFKVNIFEEKREFLEF